MNIEEVKKESSSRAQSKEALAPLVAAIFVALAFVTFPVPPPDNSVDSSLGAVLQFAHTHHLQHGKDVVFTYGPLGFLVFFYYSPHLAAVRMAVDLLLCYGVSAGVCLVAWRMTPLWRVLLLTLFVWLTPNLPSRTDFVINTGLCFWGLLALTVSSRRLPVVVLLLALLAAFAALAKLSFLFSATGLLVLLASSLGFGGRARMGVLLLASYALLFLAGWLAAGQELGNLPVFLRNALSLVEAYNEALGFEGLWPVTLMGALAGCVLAMLILLRALASVPPGTPWRRTRQALLCLWALFLGFAVWKHGYVRQDHAFYFLAFAPVAGLALEVLPASNRRLLAAARVLSLVLLPLAVAGLSLTHFSPLAQSIAQPFQSSWANLRVLLDPVAYQVRMETALAEQEKAAQLPQTRAVVGTSNVDVFGQSQAYALANKLAYRPRPVFQSYVACNAALNLLNQQFHRSPRAPDYTLFTLEPMDRKLPPLEDSCVYRDLLLNHVPVAVERQFILLKPVTQAAPRLTLQSSGAAQLGERIGLKNSNTNLWLEIDLRPSLLGHLRRFLFRPPLVRLALWNAEDGGLLVRNRAPASMLAAGFLVNPLCLRTEDVAALYTGKTRTPPGACSIQVPPGEERFWRKQVRYRLYTVESGPVRAIAPEIQEQLRAMASQPRLASGSVTTPDEHPFNLFRSPRWRPDQPAPGNPQEMLAFGLIVLLPLAFAALLFWCFRRNQANRLATNWKSLLTVNALLLGFLVSLLLLGAEVYYRFIYDTTDSLGYTRVSERWVWRHWRVNAAGCRDNIEYSPRIAPGRRRLTFVGDSFTAGHGIKNIEDRFINEWRRSHPDWETHALANVGLDTGGEIELLRKAVRRGYQFDQVVLVYCLNDIGDLVPQQGAAFESALAGAAQSNWIIRNSYFLNLASHRIQALRHPYVSDYGAYTREAYQGPPWQEQEERFKTLRDFVRLNGGQLYVVTFPFLHALGPDYPYRFVHAQLDEAWRELGVPHLDLLEVFKELSPSELTVNRHDAHPNERANQLLAEALEGWRPLVDEAAIKAKDGSRTGFTPVSPEPNPRRSPGSGQQ